MAVGGAVSFVLGVVFFGALVSLFTPKKMGILALKTNHGLGDLEGFIASGAVTPAIDRSFALSETAQAFRHHLDGRTLGKVLVTMTDGEVDPN